MKKAIISIVAAVAAIGASAATSSFTYQGVLLNAAGDAPLTGNKIVEFRLYVNETGGTALWGRTYSVLLDANGLFNVELSDASGSQISGTPETTLAKVFADNAETTLYIGVKVADSSGEIAPRQKLLPVPYATFAADVAKASGDFTVAGKITAASATIADALSVKSLAVSDTLAVSGNLTVSGTVSGYGSVPVGGIIMWGGTIADIPDGWALCNGQTVNGQKTPDLRDRFVVGAGGSEYRVGDTGGEAKHKLTVAEMPSHRHEYKYRSYDIDDGWKNQRNLYTVSMGSIDQTAYTEYTGGDQPHENRPPFYALAFIMRVK